MCYHVRDGAHVCVCVMVCVRYDGVYMYVGVMVALCVHVMMQVCVEGENTCVI